MNLKFVTDYVGTWKFIEDRDFERTGSTLWDDPRARNLKIMPGQAAISQECKREFQQLEKNACMKEKRVLDRCETSLIAETRWFE